MPSLGRRLIQADSRSHTHIHAFLCIRFGALLWRKRIGRVYRQNAIFLDYAVKLEGLIPVSHRDQAVAIQIALFSMRKRHQHPRLPAKEKHGRCHKDPAVALFLVQKSELTREPRVGRDAPVCVAPQLRAIDEDPGRSARFHRACRGDPGGGDRPPFLLGFFLWCRGLLRLLTRPARERVQIVLGDDHYG